MANAPEMREDLLPFWKAYEDLSTCRGFAGMSGVPTPIPWTAIDRYASRHGFVGDMFDDLVDITRAMDEEFRAHAMEAMENGDTE